MKKSRMGFHTGLYAIDYSDYPPFPYRGRNWHIELREPDGEFGTLLRRDGESYPARELAIFATDIDSAQRAADLVHESRLLLDGSNEMSHLYPGEHHQIRPIGGTEKNKPGTERHHISTMHLPLACLIAAKASFKLDYVYGLAKIRVSLELLSAPLMWLDPAEHENIPKSPFPEDHVRMAYAIVAAWSSIEEMGFDVRASSQRPSKLPDGSWNPPLKADLERRLRKGGVDPSKLFPWNLRGPRTRIEQRRPPQILTKAEWAQWNVRDGDMQLIDAINYVSYMRSSIAAHKYDKELIRVLSIYDVANAQQLARHLLLECLGVQKYFN